MSHAGGSHQADPDEPSSSADRSDDSHRSRGEGSSPDRSPWRTALRDVAPYLDLGWRLAGTTAFPPLLGFGLDVWLATTPWMLLGGCAVGLFGAVIQLKRLRSESAS